MDPRSMNSGNMTPPKIAQGIVKKHRTQQVTYRGIGETIEQELEKCKEYWKMRGRIEGYRQARKILVSLEEME